MRQGPEKTKGKNATGNNRPLLKGISMLVSTPYMDEALQCDDIAMIQEGRILSINTPTEMMKSYPKFLYRVASNHRYKLLQDLRSYDKVSTVFAFGSEYHASSQEALDREELTDFLTQKGHTNIVIQSIDASIEDVFMELMVEQQKQDL